MTEIEEYYSITPLLNFNSYSASIELPNCSIIKFDENQLRKRFREYTESRDSYKLFAGALCPTDLEYQKLNNKFFLCFKEKECHDSNFYHIAKALLLLQKNPARIGKIFMKDGASGTLIDFMAHQPRAKPIDIPVKDIPSEFQIFAGNNRYKIEASELSHRYLNWCLDQYGYLFWTDKVKDEFINLETDLSSLWAENKKEYRFLRFAINWYFLIHNYRELDSHIVLLFMILEILCLSEADENRKGKGGILARRIPNLISTNVQEGRALRKLIIKLYDVRSDLIHGSAYHSGKSIPTADTIFDLFDVTRRTIRVFLTKTMKEKFLKEQIIEECECKANNPPE